MPTGGITLLEVVRRSTAFLAERGSPSARLDAELLSAHVLRLRRLDLYLQFDRPLRNEELEPIRGLLRRRAAGEPVAYLVGEREFFGRPFAVTPAVLVPRPETELLVERALLWARRRGGADGAGLRIADVGTGSGCIAVTLAAELPAAMVIATDVSPDAVVVARGNAVRHGVADRLDVVEGSWLQPLVGRPPFDAVISNPPYVAGEEFAALMRDVRDFEPRLALDGGDDGLHAYRAIAEDLPPVLRPGALLALEIDPRRRLAVESLIAERLPGAAAHVSDDLAGNARVVEAVLPA